MHQTYSASALAQKLDDNTPEGVAQGTPALVRQATGRPTVAEALPRLLVIAGDSGLRATVRSMTRAPWQVVEADSGTAALAIILRGERFSSILCDAQLPDYGGLALREAIAAVAPSQADRITIMSPVMSGWDLTVLARRGAFRVLARPFTEPVFRNVLLPPRERRRMLRKA